MENLANSYRTALAEPAADDDTTIYVASITGAPEANFRIRVGDELMLVTEVDPEDPGAALDYLAVLNFEQPDGTVYIHDERGELEWDISGTVAVDTDQAKFGAASAAVSGAIKTTYTFATDTSWTLGGWVRTNTFGGGEYLLNIHPAGSFYGIAINLPSSTGVTVDISDNASSFNVVASDANTVSNYSNTWTYWAVEYDAAADKFNVYWGADRITQGTSTTGFNGAMTIALGALFFGGNYSTCMDGHLDGCFFIEQALYEGAATITPPSTAPVWEGGEPLPSAAALLNFNGDSTATVIVDDVGVLSWTAAGNAIIDASYSKFGTGCASFDGTGDYIQSSNASISGTSFTMGCWFYYSNTGADRMLFAWRSTDTTVDGFIIGTGSGGDRVAVRISDNGSSFNVADTQIFDSGSIPTSTWNFVALEYDAVAEMFSVYRNTDRIAQYSSSAGISLSSKPITVGGWFFNTLQQAWMGGIDGFFYADEALFEGAATIALPTAPYNVNAPTGGPEGIPLTVERGIEDTSAAAHDDEATVAHVLTAGGIAQWIADRYTPL